MSKQSCVRIPFILRSLDFDATLKNVCAALQHGKKLVIYGMGIHAVLLFYKFMETGIETVFFADSNSNKPDAKFLGKRIISTQKLIEDRAEFIVVTASDCYAEEMENFLRAQGYPAEGVASVRTCSLEFIILPEEIASDVGEKWHFSVNYSRVRAKPTVVFIMIVYNVPPYYLRRAIECVLGQRDGNFVFIICDNASTDGSARIINEYALRDQRIEVITFTENWVIKNDPHYLEKCLIELRSKIEKSGAQYVCQIDSDDYYAPEFTANALAFAGADMVALRPVCYCEHNPSQIRYGNMDFASRIFKNKQAIVNMRADYSLSFTAYWARLLKTEIFLNTCYGHDILDTRDILDSLSACETVAIINQPLYFHTERNTNSSTTLTPFLLPFETFAAIYNAERNFMNSFPCEKNTALIKQEFFNKILKAVLPQLEKANPQYRDLIHKQAGLTLQSPLLDELREFDEYADIIARLRDLL